MSDIDFQIEIDKINSERYESAKSTLEILWFDMLKELHKLKLTPSLLVSKIRDYNRKWNKKSEIERFLVIDSFKIFAKKQFLKYPEFGPEFKIALKYL